MGNKWDGDTEFSDNRIASVEGSRQDGWTMTLDHGWSFWCPKDSPVEPKVGMVQRQYGRGIGYPVRGLFLEGQCVFYRTEEEDRAKAKADIEAGEKKERESFENNREGIDARVAALPQIFQARLEKFRHNNPDFRWKFEGYELFCCEQAVVIATACGSPSEIQRFSKLDWDEQKKMVPGLDGGHSGNTFGCACQLAYQYLATPENVEKMHGALAPLVGSAEYGCVPKS